MADVAKAGEMAGRTAFSARQLSPATPALDSAIRRLMPSLQESARGMSRQQTFLEVIAKNIANAETTRDASGGAYVRQIGVATTDPATGESRVEIVKDASPGRLVYEPGHPDANADGYVLYPNVDVETEMVDLMMARRMYEANATVFQAAKRMLKRALEI